MEVICDRCGAEYEFEDALVSSNGTTVKCTGCGHLFKVLKAKSGPVRGAVVHPWTVRHSDGRHSEYASLKALTLGIRAGELGQDDRISRTGRIYRRLGDIVELRPFLDGVPDTVSSPPPPPSPESDNDVREEQTSATPRAPTPTRARPRRRTPAPVAPMAESSWPPAKPMEAATDRHGPAQTFPVAPVAATETDRDDDTLPNVTQPEVRAGQNAMEELDPSLLMSKPAGGQRWLLPLLAVAVAAAATLFLWQPKKPDVQRSAETGAIAAPDAKAAVQEATAKNVEQGDRLLEAHNLGGFGVAIESYKRALLRVPNDPHLLSSLSRVHAHWSQALRFELRDIEAGAYPGSPHTPEQIQADEQRHAAEAKEYAVRAARKNPGNEEAEVALADALRLTGNLVGARLEVDRVMAHQTRPDAETLRVAAMLAIAETDGDLRAGRTLTKRAALSDDCTIACRILNLRVLLAVGELSAAETALSAMQRENPELPQLPRFASLLRAARKTAAPPPAPLSASTPIIKADVEAPSSADVDHANELCVEGEKRLEQGAVSAAVRLFQEAIELVPAFARAEVGLGYVALERGVVRVALRHFRTAAAADYPEAFIGLGETYRALQRRPAAIRAYQTYLARFPNNRAASIARQQLEMLRLEPTKTEEVSSQ